MTPMILLLLKHLLLAGVGAGVLFVLAFVLRLIAGRDAVVRYRIMVAALVAVAAALPVQLVVAELSASPGNGEDRAQRGALAAASGSMASLVGISAARGERASLAASGTTQPSGQPSGQLSGSVATPTSTLRGVGVDVDMGAFGLLVYVLGGVYVMGVVVVCALHVRGVLAARRLLALARPVCDARVLEIWGRVAERADRRVRLLECAGLSAPACSPWGRAAVLLPSPAGSLDEDTLSISMRHELVHIARRDGVISAVAAVVRALLWFQPLTWVFVRALGVDREQSCDAIVVRCTGRAQTYARVLLRFCDVRAAEVQPVPLIGFESAQSLTRRIRMLSHASQPVSQVRRVRFGAVAVATLAGALTAQGFLTASADPGSLVPQTAVSPTTSPASALAAAVEPKTAGAVLPSKVEVRAAVGGRSEADVYRRAMEIQHKREEIATPGGRVRKHTASDDPLAFFYLSDAPLAYARGTWVTDEEPILAAGGARVDNDTLRAGAVRVRLPGGSKLRAVFEGRSVTVEADAGQKSRVLVTGGVVRVVDEAGIVRCEIRAGGEGATLAWTASASGAVDAFDIAASGEGGVAVKIDSRSGVPAGERQPPHGAVRWSVVAPVNGGDETRVQMQWTYDLGELRNPEGC